MPKRPSDAATGSTSAAERGQVQFGMAIILYTIVRSARRRKTIEIRLDPSAGVLVAAPLGTSAARIQAVVAKRAGWIVQRAAAAVVQTPRRDLVSGGSLLYLGREVPLLVEETEVRRTEVTFGHRSFQVALPKGLTHEERQALVELALTRWYQAQAAAHLGERVTWWSQQMGCTPRAVLVRAQRRRWGSCGPDGTLRFNWRIVMAPPELIDYVVVHELAHLRVRNHSPAFWAEVARFLPDYRKRQAALRELGPSLAW